MVVRFKKKLRKQRGYRWHGYGSKKKHRNKGSKGGCGFAGMCKHKWSYVTKEAQGVFGSKGFVPIGKKKQKTINLDSLDMLARKLNKKEIDLSDMGFTKLLARGDVTQALKVTVESFSAGAKSKLEKAGGSIVE